MSTSDLGGADVKATVDAKRAELESTLDAIEEKLNIPKQAGRLAKKVESSYDENPVPWIAGATAAIVVIGGLIAWAIFGDD
ncbi:MAG: hypothetical protein JWP30_1519 [Homoserinimonas sp.]|jgi:hypothetical protein|nr:hypothetical protein [Homoserinimonas sp.]